MRDRAAAPLDEQIRHAFRLCLARAPDDAELGVLRRLHAAQLAAARSDPAAAKVLAAQGGRESTERLDELVAWYAVASALLNLDETITKN